MHIFVFSFSGTHLNFTKLPALLNIPCCSQILQKSVPFFYYSSLFILQNILYVYSDTLPSHGTYNECKFCLIEHLCVSEFPPFHLAVWCQVKRTCCSMNLPVIVHTCNEKCQDHFLYSQVVMYWTFSEQNGEKTTS